jgi:glycosyltransferase involved in cell wall biosynthesis
MPKITVIVTAYKDRGWINEAILSAKNQIFFDDYEIVLCVDGNPDLISYAEKHEIPFFNFPKSNYANMVNQAIGLVKGEWIKVLHDDDLLTPACLVDLYNARGEADLVYGNALCFNNDDLAGSQQYRPPSNVTIKNLLPIGNNPVNFEAELFKRDMFINIGGFDPKLGYAEDYDFLLNLLSKGYKVTHCDKDVVWYRHHPRQITGNEPAMRQSEHEYLQSKYMDVIVNQIKWSV